MPKQKDEDLPEPDWELIPVDFKGLVRELMIAEIRVMVTRLQEVSSFSLSKEVDFEKLDVKTLTFLKKQLRDTLRTLGGGR